MYTFSCNTDNAKIDFKSDYKYTRESVPQEFIHKTIFDFTDNLRETLILSDVEWTDLENNIFDVFEKFFNYPEYSTYN